MLRTSHRGYVRDYVTVHGNEELLFGARAALGLVELPQFSLAEAGQYPLVFAADHFLAVRLAKHQQGPFFVEIAQDYSHILFLQLVYDNEFNWSLIGV